MIVQYLIDWHYIRMQIQDSAADDNKLEVIRFQLGILRRGLQINGVLFSDHPNKCIQELNAIILEDLKQTDGGETVMSWKRLADELSAYQKVYGEKSIRLRLEIGDGEDSFLALLRERRKMLEVANLLEYKLPCAIITDRNLRNTGNECVLRLNQYEKSSVEEFRARWEDISFDVGQEVDADRFWAGVSLGASVFGSVSLIDPFCLCIIFRDGRMGHWDVSINKIVGFFARNNYVKHITLVGREHLANHRTLYIKKVGEDLSAELGRMQVKRQDPFIFGVRLKSSTDWHDRWINIEIAICSLHDGLEVYKKGDNGGIRIRRAFEVNVVKDKTPAQFNAVDSAPNESYKEFCSRCKNNLLKCDAEGVDEVASSDPKNNIVEIKVLPGIFIKLGCK